MYTRMDPAGTLQKQVLVSGTGAAAVGTPRERSQTTSGDEEGASAQCGHRSAQENRYIISN